MVARFRGPKILRLMRLAISMLEGVWVKKRMGEKHTIGAGAWDDETLERGESKVPCAGGEEWLRGRNELLVTEETVETFLFTFLTDDGCDTTSQGVVVVVGEDFDDILKSSKNDIREC